MIVPPPPPKPGSRQWWIEFLIGIALVIAIGIFLVFNLPNNLFGMIVPLTVWGMYGGIGNGKTLQLVEHADTWSLLRKTTLGKHIDAGLPVYGNLDIYKESVPTYRKITCDEFMRLDAHKDLLKAGVDKDDLKTHALVLISEPHAWGMDARISASKIAREMAKKGTQSRKARLDIFFDTQIPSEIDKRFRHICKVTWLALEPIEDNNGDLLLFRYAYFGRYIQKLLGIDKKEANKLWGMYDTEQHIEEEFTEEYLAELEEKGDIGTQTMKQKVAHDFKVDKDGVRVYSN